MRVPVTLPSWIVGDGAVPVPSVEDSVSYRVVFSAAEPNDLPALCIQHQATARTVKANNDGRFAIELSFPTFAATMSSEKPIDGDVSVTGRLIIDYEIAINPENRLDGTVVDRKLLIEEALLPSDPKALTVGDYPVTQELHEIGPQSFHFSPRPRPTLGASWRTEAGLVLTIDVPDH